MLIEFGKDNFRQLNFANLRSRRRGISLRNVTLRTSVGIYNVSLRYV